MNTHGLIVTFGKHKGLPWTRVPASYLRWMVNEPETLPGFEEHKKIAQAELDRRGTKVHSECEISPHAIDRASLRVRRTWHETALDKEEGLYSWLSRMASEALASVEGKPECIFYKGMKFVFKQGNQYPVLKSVMPA